MRKTDIETIELTPDDARVELAENRPFVIRGASAGSGVGILLVHGFTGTPWEMRDIGRQLARESRLVLGVRLPGHGTSPEDLAGRTCEEWLAAVAEGYRHLQGECDRIIGVGLSTGALLLAAAGHLSFAGLALISPYLRMRHMLAPLAGLLRHVVRYNRRPVDFGPSPYYYRDRPVAGVYQINRLIRRVKKGLKAIDCPALVASSAGDVTVRSESAVTLYSRLRSDRKEFYRFGREVPHVLTTADNPRQEEFLQIVSNFTRAVIANGSATAPGTGLRPRSGSARAGRSCR